MHTYIISVKATLYAYDSYGEAVGFSFAHIACL